MRYYESGGLEMKKTLAVMLCALLLCFAFTSCRNVYIPVDMIPGFGEEQISEEEAASAVAAYIDQFDFNKIKDEVGTPLLNSFIDDAKTQLEADLGINDIDAIIGSSSISSAAISLGMQLLANGILTAEDFEAAFDINYGPSGLSVTLKEGAIPVIARILCENVLPSLQKATGTHGNYSIRIRDFNGVTEESIANILSILLEETNENVSEDFSVTLAVDCSELDSSLFKSTSYAYSGTLYFTIDFSVVNDGSLNGGDVYIDFDKITANTERALQATESVERHRIRIDGVSAELPWTLGKGAGFDLAYEAYFKPLEVGTVRYDSTAVPFSMILPLTDNI